MHYIQTLTLRNFFLFLALFVLGAVSMANSGFYENILYPNELDPQLALIGRSRVQTNNALDLHVVSLGKDGEPCAMPETPVIICEGPEIPSGTSTPTSKTIELEMVKDGVYKPMVAPKLTEEGFYLLTARDPNGRVLPFGLPVHATTEPPALNLYWGDLHGHSTLSDGAREPEEYYRWARDVARLDVMALADHNWALSEEKIEKIRQLATEWYEPGRFVPFFAFEWAVGKARPSPSRGRPDHKHLIFRRTDEEFKPWAPWKDTPSVERLWEMLEGRDVIAVPHHTGLPHDTHYGTDWSKHSEKFERVAEIFSDWGSSETAQDRYPLPEMEQGNFVRDALKRGYHVGFVGGSDTHLSRPGLNALPRMGHPYALTALTAIESPSLTRDDLWVALYNRRCYATSGGRRILLDVSLNGASMGERITQSFGVEPRTLKATVVGSTRIREIIIVKNSEQVASFKGTGWCQAIEWTDNSPSTNTEDSYYVRAEMEDTSMAWSSPVWVAGASSDPDIAAETRLWRLDGDVLDRKFKVLNADARDIMHAKPLTLCSIKGAGAIDRIVIDALAGNSEDVIRSAMLSVQIDGETTPSLHTRLDLFFFPRWVESLSPPVV